jgi:hypothetical protein
MSDGSLRNFSVISPSMGKIVFNPEFINKEEIQSTALVVFTGRISKATFEVACEWASNAQMPIFCHFKDIELFQKEGFGSYRFHRLESYREIDFQKGSIEFFAARRWKTKELFSRISLMLEYFGFMKPQNFHVLIRPKQEKPVLVLGSPEIDSLEWKMLVSHSPSTVIGTAAAPAAKWKFLSHLTATHIVLASEIESVRTNPLREKRTESSSWPASAELV